MLLSKHKKNKERLIAYSLTGNASINGPSGHSLSTPSPK
jgi:hypothetical protein